MTVYMCVYVYMYVHAYTCMYMHVDVSTYMYVCTEREREREREMRGNELTHDMRAWHDMCNVPRTRWGPHMHLDGLQCCQTLRAVGRQT